MSLVNSVPMSTFELSTALVDQVAGAVGVLLVGERRAGILVAVKAWPFWRCSAFGSLKVMTRHLRDGARLPVVVVGDHVAIGLDGGVGVGARRHPVLRQPLQLVLVPAYCVTPWLAECPRFRLIVRPGPKIDVKLR